LEQGYCCTQGKPYSELNAATPSFIETVELALLPQSHDVAKREKGRDHGEKTIKEIARGYNVTGWTISRLTIPT
jgi:hypothetical protein